MINLIISQHATDRDSQFKLMHNFIHGAMNGMQVTSHEYQVLTIVEAQLKALEKMKV